MRVYTKDAVIQKCRDWLKEKDVTKFYTAGIINSRGITSDTKDYYSEIIAEFVLSNIDLFKGINSIKRAGKKYKTASHNGKYEKRTKREEEYIAKDMFNECKTGEYDYIGKIIDYQTPLNNKKTDGYGKIDLLSYKDDSLYILELKRPNSKSPETMLRCALESYTYSKIVNKDALIEDFELSTVIDKSKIYAAPLVAINGTQWEEYTNKEEHPRLVELMKQLNIKPFYYEEISPKHDRITE